MHTLAIVFAGYFTGVALWFSLRPFSLRSKIVALVCAWGGLVLMTWVLTQQVYLVALLAPVIGVALLALYLIARKSTPRRT